VLCGAELIEWRADFYDNVLDEPKIEETLRSLRQIINNIPLIFTIRTDAEGGKLHISGADYANLLKFVAGTGEADIIDVELFKDGVEIGKLVEEIHAFDVLVIMSNHNFTETPEKDEIINRLRKMQELGADLPKIALMPNSPADVLCLLTATEEMASKYATKPLVTMSMGGLGSISRLSGEVFGSSMTFGTAGKSSAPGQISVSELKQCLQTIHSSLDKS
jgi:3-dehydroquinate dehydratase-1